MKTIISADWFKKSIQAQDKYHKPKIAVQLCWEKIKFILLTTKKQHKKTPKMIKISTMTTTITRKKSSKNKRLILIWMLYWQLVFKMTWRKKILLVCCFLRVLRSRASRIYWAGLKLKIYFRVLDWKISWLIFC